MDRCVLTVDGLKTVRGAITSGLKGRGYQVIEAADGEDASRKLDQFVFDLIIVDLQMPKMDGLELVSNIRRNRATRFTPVILLTSEYKEVISVKCKQVGASCWINKSFSPNQLNSVVEMVVGRCS